jgi:integrase
MSRRPKIIEVRPGIWAFRFSHGHDPVTGHRIQERVQVVGTRADAERELLTLERQKALRSSPTSSITVNEVRGLWDESTRQQGRRRPSTAGIEESAYQRHLSPLIGEVTLSRLDSRAITRAYDELLRTCSPALVRRLHQQLSSILTWSYRRGYIDEVPTTRVEVPRIHRRPPDAPTTSEVRGLLASIEDRSLWLACRLAATLGLRRGELAGLRFDDVDFETGRLNVERSVTCPTGECPQVTPTKTADRGVGSLALDDELLQVLEREFNEARRIAFQLGLAPTDLFIIRGPNPLVPIRPDTLTRRLKNHVATHPDYEQITLHALRRYVASTLVESGVDIATAGLVLRHSDHSTTARYYVAQRADRARDVTRSIGQDLEFREVGSA